MRRLSKQLAIADMLLLFLAALAGSEDAWAASTVTFAVQASKAQYAPGEMPAFTMTLALSSTATAPIAVCPIQVGNVHVLRLTRDGTRVRPARAVTKFYDEPSVFQMAALTLLLPGQSANLPYHLDLGSDGATPEIEDIRVASRITRDHKVLGYRLERPGQYAVQFAYDYKGPDGGRSDVLRTRIASNIVTFALQ